MPRRGRHRTTLPVRLIAAFAALLVTGGIAVAAGSAAAQDDSGDGGLLGALTSQDSGSKDSDGADDGSKDGEGGDESPDGSDAGQDGQDGQQDADKDADKDADTGGDQGGRDDADQADNQNGDEGEKPDEAQVAKKDAEKKVEFPGREKAKPAGDDEYVDITEVDANGGNRGEGGVFGGGSYTVNCGVSDHNNSDNYMAAPGKKNGAQHVHDYVGNEGTDANTEHGTLDENGTSCSNGDKSTFFWPVLRDLDGTGPDAGENGGGLDGNVGSILKPTSADLTFHGHPGQETKEMPHGLMMIMGNAKAKAQDGDNANSKYTCSGFTDRVTEKYPVCPSGSKLMRMLDYPSCWDGQNLESKDFRSHISYPGSDGKCGGDTVAIPQLRITLSYDQPAGDRFAIDSFPDNQHDPTTDHSDFENASSEEQATAGATCIADGLRCGKG